MADMLLKVTMDFIDFEGETATTAFWAEIDDATTAADIDSTVSDFVAYVDACSNAALKSYTWSHEYYGTGVQPVLSGTEPYSNIEEKAYIKFAAINGRLAAMSIPAPKVGMFDSDQETLNPTAIPLSNLVSNWFTAVEDNNFHTTDNDGVKLKEYNFGYRRRSHSRSEKPGRHIAKG